MRKDRPDEIIHKMTTHLSAALTCAALCEDKKAKEKIRKITTCQMTMAQHIDYLKQLSWDLHQDARCRGEINENPS